ncbi:hypothetical protein RintRC_7626 [Richelia intracellularis]|nr:hypothetical protein RintRC_7626 [Richelia intracellularis]
MVTKLPEAISDWGLAGIVVVCVVLIPWAGRVLIADCSTLLNNTIDASAEVTNLLSLICFYLSD